MRPARASIVFLFVGIAVLAQAQEYVISTIAGGAPPPTPIPGVNMSLANLPTTDLSVAADTIGNTYFVALHCVFKLDQNGIVTRIAGNGEPGYSGDGGPATSAQLQADLMAVNVPYSDPPPPAIAVDKGGNVYVADNGNYRVREISATGIITTVAGNGTAGFSGDGGPALSAQLSPVFGLAFDLAGNLLIADSGSNRIRRITADGRIATVTGTGDCGFGGDGGPAVVAQICVPTGIATDGAGNLYIADTGNNRIRQITPEGSITTMAATGTATSVALDQAGSLYVNDAETDGWNIWQVVKKILPSGAITTVAGMSCDQTILQPPCGADGTSAIRTFFGGPLSLAVDSAGNLLVGEPGDGGKKHIRKVSPDGAITTVVGSCGGLPGFEPPDCQSAFLGDGGPANSAQVTAWGAAVDAAGNLFIADYVNERIRKISPDGIITTLSGNGTYGSAGDGGPAARAQMAPLTVTVDSMGNLFFFDVPARNIRKISLDGMITTVIFLVDFSAGVALNGAGDLLVASDLVNPGSIDGRLYGAVLDVLPNGTIRRVAGSDVYGAPGFLGDGGPATAAQLHNPHGVAVDAAGNIFIADSENHRIRKITPDGTITTVAGNSPLVDGKNPGDLSYYQGGFSGDGGPAVDAQLNYPTDVAVDRAGNLYIADYSNARIRSVSPDGIITTIAGNGIYAHSGDGGPARKASLRSPTAIALDRAGNIYVADQDALRVLRPISEDRLSRH